MKLNHTSLAAPDERNRFFLGPLQVSDKRVFVLGEIRRWARNLAMEQAFLDLKVNERKKASKFKVQSFSLRFDLAFGLPVSVIDPAANIR